MEQKGILSAGQRLLLKSDAVLLQVTKGSAEVYGVTRKKDGTEDALSFRRCYLMDIGPGEAAFPAIDEFKEIRVQIYALEEMEYTLCPLENVETEALRAHMTRWFSRLVELPWLRLMADKGDDMLQEWKKGRVFRKLDSKEELLAEFAEHEEVLSMFMGMRFGAEDKRLSRRILLREKARKLLVENGIRSLLGEEMLFVGEADNPSTGRQVEDASFIVQQVAKALKMPTDTISISEETARDLDYVALLRRLMQKGNMQMRLVTLPENWYKKDTGVMIGFYTPPGAAEKEMAAFIPETPE
ncbi:MAG: hypothetical protein IIZ87_00350, partial [Selenomonas sp.]|nr:hypothetical protein [Selenomonas sp.]